MKRENIESCFHILLVDDEINMHEMTTRTLKNYLFQQKGVKLHLATSQNDAFFLISKHDIAVVLIRYKSGPTAVGESLVKHIRKSSNNKDMQIILLLESNSSISEQKMVETFGINGFLERMVLNQRRLKTAITTALWGYARIIEIRNELIDQKLQKNPDNRLSGFHGSFHLVKALYNYLLKGGAFKQVAVFDRDEISLCSGNESGFRDTYKEWVKSDEETLGRFFFIRIRELEGFVIVVQSDSSVVKSNKVNSNAVNEQATVAREGLINIVTNEKLLADLNQICTNRRRITYLQSSGRNLLLHSTDKPPMLLTQQLKTINTFFDEESLVQINRSTIISIDMVKRFERASSRKMTVELKSGELFDVSRSNIFVVEQLLKERGFSTR